MFTYPVDDPVMSVRGEKSIEYSGSSVDDDYLAEKAVLKQYNQEKTLKYRDNEYFSSLDKTKTELTPESAVTTATQYELGDNDTFWVADDYIIDYDAQNWDEAMYEVEARVVRKTEHMYIFQDYEVTVSDSDLDDLSEEFESVIYPTDTEFFGEPPDTDNNGRIIILLLDIRDAAYHGEGSSFIAGYFWILHTYPPSENQDDLLYYSEYKEIIHVDIECFTKNIDKDTVAHEFQHLLHCAKDSEETVWLDEGCAVLAEYLCGYYNGWINYITGSSGFLNSPQTSLTYWQGNFASYGAVFNFMLMIQQAYGNDTVRAIVESKEQGMPSVTAVTGTSAVELYAEYAYRNIINDEEMGYGYGVFSGIAAHTDLSSLPESRTGETVPFWASKYYIIPNGEQGILNVTVTGSGGQKIKADLLVINQSGLVENFSVKQVDDDTGQFQLNNFGIDYNDAILVVFSLNGTDSGWYPVTSVSQDVFDISINIISVHIEYDGVQYNYLDDPETLLFYGIVVNDTITGNTWGFNDVLPSSTSVIINSSSGLPVTGFSGVIQWNLSHGCWQVYFDNLTGLDSGEYFVQVTLKTVNTTVTINSPVFTVVRPVIMNNGSFSFKNGVLKYQGIQIGYTNGTIWPGTITATFGLYYENGTLILNSVMTWVEQQQSWEIPAGTIYFDPGARVYLIFTFIYQGETITFQSGILENTTESTSIIPGFVFFEIFIMLSSLALTGAVIRRLE
ncbi:MAG: hypothetical protein ACTSP4_05450 [Candidatus Hodarchaeales archaeon]